jgi:hypothetical protein
MGWFLCSAKPSGEEPKQAAFRLLENSFYRYYGIPFITTAKGSKF